MSTVDALAADRTLRLPVDLHARPAGKFSQRAARFRSTVTVAVRDREVDAGSVLLVMGLGATAGSDVTIHAIGDDAAEAVEVLGDLLLAGEE